MPGHPFKRRNTFQYSSGGTWGHFLLSCHLLLRRRELIPTCLQPPFVWSWIGLRSSPRLLFSRLNTPAPHPLLICFILQILSQLCCPSLDPLQFLNVFTEARVLKLNTGSEVRPYQCQVQGFNHCSGAVGHILSDLSQDALGFLGQLGIC